MSTNISVNSTANVDEIRKELAVLASIDTGLLGKYALRARKDRMMLLAFQLSEASQGAKASEEAL